MNFFARFDTPNTRGFVNLMLGAYMALMLAVGFVIFVTVMTYLANTQYVPAAQQNPFASGVILAGTLFGLYWLRSRRVV